MNNTRNKELIMDSAKKYMNPPTGSVDTYDNWLAEGYDPEDKANGLIEVEWDEAEQCWVEV